MPSKSGVFCKVARGPVEPSANGRSSSLIIQGLDSSRHARGHNSSLAGSTKKKDKGSTEACAGCSRSVFLNAEREVGKFSTCWRSVERTRLAEEA